MTTLIINRVDITAGEIFTGATTLHFDGVVDEATGKVSGHARITETLKAPAVDIFISPVSGQVHHLGFGIDKRIVCLTGHYTVPLGPPPLIGEILETFTAVLDLEPKGEWKGEGSFTYGSTHVDNVPVRPVA